MSQHINKIVTESYDYILFFIQSLYQSLMGTHLICQTQPLKHLKYLPEIEVMQESYHCKQLLVYILIVSNISVIPLGS